MSQVCELESLYHQAGIIFHRLDNNPFLALTGSAARACLESSKPDLSAIHDIDILSLEPDLTLIHDFDILIASDCVYDTFVVEEDFPQTPIHADVIIPLMGTNYDRQIRDDAYQNIQVALRGTIDHLQVATYEMMVLACEHGQGEQKFSLPKDFDFARLERLRERERQLKNRALLC
jgi:hypothetical protein